MICHFEGLDFHVSKSWPEKMNCHFQAIDFHEYYNDWDNMAPTVFLSL